MHPRRPPAWLAVPVILGFALRVGLVVAQTELQLFQVFYDAADSVLYRGLAESLLEHGRYWFNDHPTAYVTPGYPLFLAGLFSISKSTLFIAVVQSVLGAVTVGLVADTARRIAGRRAAWAAGLSAAVYPHFLFWTGYVLTETLYAFFFTLGIWALIASTAKPSDAPWWPLGAGAAWGLAVLTRPNPLVFVVGVGIIGLFQRRWRRAAALGLLALSAVWLPWVIRNAITLDAFIPTSSEAGVILWQGNSPGATGGTRGYVDSLDFDDLPAVEGLEEVEQERVYRDAALEWMVDNPLRVVALVPRKLGNMFRPTYAGASALNTFVTLFTYLPLLFAGAVGLVFAWQHGGLPGRLLVTLVGYHLIIHGLLTGMIRFRLPVEIVLCVAAGVTVSWFRERTADAAA